MVYRHKTSPSPRKFEVIASARKALSTIFWDMKGVVHMEFLKQGHRVNSEKYISTLRNLKARLRRVRSGRDSILQHDNARPHTSRQTQDALAQLKLPALPHPAYSPDLAPSDYFLFLQLKKHMKGNHYGSDEEVVAAVRQWCREQSPEFFADGIRQLVRRWQLCVDRDGDYVEKINMRCVAEVSSFNLMYNLCMYYQKQKSNDKTELTFQPTLVYAKIKTRNRVCLDLRCAHTNFRRQILNLFATKAHLSLGQESVIINSSRERNVTIFRVLWMLFFFTF